MQRSQKVFHILVIDALFVQPDIPSIPAPPATRVRHYGTAVTARYHTGPRYTAPGVVSVSYIAARVLLPPAETA